MAFETTAEWIQGERVVSTHYAENVPVMSVSPNQPPGLFTNINVLREALDQSMASARRIMTGLFGPGAWPDQVDATEKIRSPECFADDLAGQVYIARQLADRLQELEKRLQS